MQKFIYDNGRLIPVKFETGTTLLTLSNTDVEKAKILESEIDYHNIGFYVQLDGIYEFTTTVGDKTSEKQISNVAKVPCTNEHKVGIINITKEIIKTAEGLKAVEVNKNIALNLNDYFDDMFINGHTVNDLKYTHWGEDYKKESVELKKQEDKEKLVRE